MEMIFVKRWRLSGNRLLPVMILLGLLIMDGCALMQGASLPPISPTPTGQHQIGKFVWFDLLTEDVNKAQKFYKGLFGWRFATAEQTPDYTVIYSGDKPIGGIAPYQNKDPKVLESMWLATLSVEDVDRAVSMVKARGGQVMDGPLDVKGRGRMSVVQDPEGAELVLIRAAGGDPADAAVKSGEWLWVDLFSGDVKKAADFYGALAGYTAQTVKTEGDHAYQLLRRGGRVYAGVVELRWKEVEPNWLPYTRVDDIKAVIGRAEKLGGILLLRVESVAVLEDPTGGVFGIQEFRRKKS